MNSDRKDLQRKVMPAIIEKLKRENYVTYYKEIADEYKEHRDWLVTNVNDDATDNRAYLSSYDYIIEFKVIEHKSDPWYAVETEGVLPRKLAGSLYRSERYEAESFAAGHIKSRAKQHREKYLQIKDHLGLLLADVKDTHMTVLCIENATTVVVNTVDLQNWVFGNLVDCKAFSTAENFNYATLGILIDPKALHKAIDKKEIEGFYDITEHLIKGTEYARKV